MGSKVGQWAAEGRDQDLQQVEILVVLDWINLWHTQRVAELEESNMAKTQITKSCQVLHKALSCLVNTICCCTDIDDQTSAEAFGCSAEESALC